MPSKIVFFLSFIQHWISDLEIFACILAAVMHDFEHTGTTNNFHINTGWVIPPHLLTDRKSERDKKKGLELNVCKLQIQEALYTNIIQYRFSFPNKEKTIPFIRE